MDRRLWEAEHSYYCEEGNYCAYKSWADFIASEGDSDLDYNLVFRWDWSTPQENVPRVESDPHFRGAALKLFFMGQRKGLYRAATVEVCRADEPEARAWLETRWEHLRKLWAPVSDE